MTIRKNVIHDNGQFGIICSLNCNNITIENNVVYHDGNKNTGAGIMFSRNMVNSIARTISSMMKPPQASQFLNHITIRYPITQFQIVEVELL